MQKHRGRGGDEFKISTPIRMRKHRILRDYLYLSSPLVRDSLQYHKRCPFRFLCLSNESVGDVPRAQMIDNGAEEAKELKEGSGK